jgi:LacI family sucrose operon transcriptional repressor
MATIKDVAERAGVTVTTVSRVLNNRGYISQSTRERVYQVMKEMHYQPNEIARSLSRKRSMIMGLIIPTISHPFFSELTHHIENYASSKGYKILICNSRMNKKKEKEYLDMLRSNRVDGVIMCSHTLEVEEYVKMQQRIVTFDRRIANIPYVASDNYASGVLAAELLLKRGCKQPAHICGNLSLDMLANRRTEAFMATVSKQGLQPILLQLEPDVFDYTFHKGKICELLQEHPDIDGLFISGDIIAIHAIHVCKELGISVPEQMKIIGYDDIHFASLMNPGITTIRQPTERMARKIVDLLDEMANGNQVMLENVFPVQLIERATT